MPWPCEQFLSESQAAANLDVDQRSLRVLMTEGICPFVTHHSKVLIPPSVIPNVREYLRVASGVLKPDE